MSEWPPSSYALQDYRVIEEGGIEDGTRSDGLLFPGRKGRMHIDLRGSLGTAVEKAEITKNVRWKTFRHTYTSMRVQTLDNGEPISTYTVRCELGHSTTALIDRTYGHLMKNRVRLSEVTYRPQQQEAVAKHA